MVDLREDAIEGMQRVSQSLSQANAEIRRITSDTTLFCVSESQDNLLMWSHYAQNHTGAVIKFLSLADVVRRSLRLRRSVIRNPYHASRLQLLWI